MTKHEQFCPQQENGEICGSVLFEIGVWISPCARKNALGREIDFGNFGNRPRMCAWLDGWFLGLWARGLGFGFIEEGGEHGGIAASYRCLPRSCDAT